MLLTVYYTHTCFEDIYTQIAPISKKKNPNKTKDQAQLYPQPLELCFSCLPHNQFNFFVCLFVLPFLGPHLRHMEVPRLEVQLELQLPATATATPDLSRVCNLHHCSWQHRILNPRIEARDETCNLMVPLGIRFHCAMTGMPQFEFYFFIFSLRSSPLQSGILPIAPLKLLLPRLLWPTVLNPDRSFSSRVALWVHSSCSPLPSHSLPDLYQTPRTSARLPAIRSCLLCGLTPLSSVRCSHASLSNSSSMLGKLRPRQGTPANAWRHFWLAWAEEGCYWHIVRRGQHPIMHKTVPH